MRGSRYAPLIFSARCWVEKLFLLEEKGLVRKTCKGKIFNSRPMLDAGEDLLRATKGQRFGAILADPPWQFQNKTGKVAPEHRRLNRYSTLTLDEIASLPVAKAAAETSHLYLWVPNALLPDGLAVMKAWGFSYKSNIVWHKIRKDGGPDGRGVGFYFRNVTELLLFGVRGKNARTLPPGRRQVNYLATRKREHSRKPDEQYALIEACSSGPFLELFARGIRKGWECWGAEANGDYEPSWATYKSTSCCPAQPKSATAFPEAETELCHLPQREKEGRNPLSPPGRGAGVRGDFPMALRALRKLRRFWSCVRVRAAKPWGLSRRGSATPRWSRSTPMPAGRCCTTGLAGTSFKAISRHSMPNPTAAPGSSRGGCLVHPSLSQESSGARRMNAISSRRHSALFRKCSPKR